MFKVIWLLKRKQGVSHAEFREHFESAHVPLAQKYIGHLFLGYKRTYVDQAFGRLGVDDKGESIYGPREWDFDLISEWLLPDEAAYQEVLKIMTGDVIKQFHALEEQFLDRPSQTMLRCSTVETEGGYG